MILVHKTWTVTGRGRERRSSAEAARRGGGPPARRRGGGTKTIAVNEIESEGAGVDRGSALSPVLYIVSASLVPVGGCARY